MSVADKLGFGPKREFIPTSRGWLVTITPHPMSGCSKSQQLEITDDQYHRIHKWLLGYDLIQNILPDLSKDQREILLSGLDPKDQDNLFSDYDE